ncbi:MAG: HEPN domain-containing protein [Oscillospiraceae bacterium]|jgi:uncharacterized protein (UPF0332 family)|nr:HEPN domain-containing protein [Oscillospiraceae bacterium]
MNFEVAIEYLREAEDRLNDAYTLYKANSAKGAVVNSYYTAFNAISAVYLLDHDNLFTDHSQLIGVFNKKYIYQEKAFEYEISKTINTLYSIRISADYLNKRKKPITLEQAYESISNAETVLNDVKDYITDRAKTLSISDYKNRINNWKNSISVNTVTPTNEKSEKSR